MKAEVGDQVMGADVSRNVSTPWPTVYGRRSRPP